VKYRKPSMFNWVTAMLILLAALCVYLIVCLWPVYSARSRAKGVLLDHVPAMYRANLRTDDYGRSMMEGIKKDIAAALAKAGINEKGAKIILRRGQKDFEMEVRFKARAHFPFPDKTYEFELAPKVVSDAARVDW